MPKKVTINEGAGSILKIYIITLLESWRKIGLPVQHEHVIDMDDDAVIVNAKQEQILDNLYQLQVVLKNKNAKLANFLLQQATFFMGGPLALSLFGADVKNRLFKKTTSIPLKMILTNKERRILHLYSQGFQFSNIAKVMGYSIRYVQALMGNLYVKYGYTDIVHLTSEAIRLKLIPPISLKRKIYLQNKDRMYLQQRSWGIKPDAICAEIGISRRTVEGRMSKLQKTAGLKGITTLCSRLISAGELA